MASGLGVAFDIWFIDGTKLPTDSDVIHIPLPPAASEQGGLSYSDIDWLISAEPVTDEMVQQRCLDKDGKPYRILDCSIDRSIGTYLSPQTTLG
jgi:hypothetical protein